MVGSEIFKVIVECQFILQFNCKREDLSAISLTGGALGTVAVNDDFVPLHPATFGQLVRDAPQTACHFENAPALLAEEEMVVMLRGALVVGRGTRNLDVPHLAFFDLIASRLDTRLRFPDRPTRTAACSQIAWAVRGEDEPLITSQIASLWRVL